ncbi:MAG: hypothetical protein ABI673_10570 [Novosphingobium sp.]
MRVALLSMMDPAQAGNPAPRAFLRLGGVTLARHQMTLALAAGCERIACLTAGGSPELTELQQGAEQAGVHFHPISGARALSGLVTAADEVLVITDGVLAARGEALRLIAGSPAVLVQPAQLGIPAGFERIGPDLASAGLMLLPGRLIEQLSELPADVDPTSALLRIALQAGVPQRPVPDHLVTAGHWLLVHDEDEAHAAEHAWMERHMAAPMRTPGPMLASVLVRRFGPALLHSGSKGTGMAVAAVSLVALAFGLAWFGWASLAFALCIPAWLIRRSAAILERISSDTLAKAPGLRGNEAAFGWALDCMTVVLLTLSIAPVAGVGGEAGLLERSFAPLVFVALLRILPRAFPHQGTVWLTDRALIMAVLAVLAGLHVLGPALLLMVLAMLVAGLILPSLPIDSAGLTRV